jgi:hypothetical protein
MKLIKYLGTEVVETICFMMQHFIKGELCFSSLCINQAYCVLLRGLTSGYVTYLQILSEPSILLSHMWRGCSEK